MPLYHALPMARGHCNRDALAALVDAGRNIQARVINNYMAWLKGSACLYIFVYFARSCGRRQASITRGRGEGDDSIRPLLDNSSDIEKCAEM